MKYLFCLIVLVGCSHKKVITEQIKVEQLTIITMYGRPEKCIIGKIDGKRVSRSSYSAGGTINNIEQLWETAKPGDIVEIKRISYE